MRKVHNYEPLTHIFHAFIDLIEQANLPQDITVQFTGINL
jgi:hypothetical protein